MKTYTLDEVQDELIGKTGTPERDRFEEELRVEILAMMLKTKIRPCCGNRFVSAERK